VTGVGTLVRYSLRRWRGFLTATTLVLVVFQFFMILAARNLELSGRFQLLEAVLPAFMTRAAEREGLVDTIKAVRERAERGL